MCPWIPANSFSTPWPRTSRPIEPKLFAGYYKNRKLLRSLFTDGVSPREYQASLELYGVCEERFFAYQPRRLVVSNSLIKLLLKPDRERLARMVYNRTQFTKAAREEMKLLGKFTATKVRLLDFSHDRGITSLADHKKTAILVKKSKTLIDWLRDDIPGHQAIPVTYSISKRAWSRYLNKPEIPILTMTDLPIGKEDTGGHAVAIVGWTPNVAGFLEQPKVSDLVDNSGYFIIKNSWGTKWGGFGGYGLIRADLHRLTILQALLIEGVQRRTSSKVVSPYTQQMLIDGDSRPSSSDVAIARSWSFRPTPAP